jgi:hypothetical protein
MAEHQGSQWAAGLRKETEIGQWVAVQGTTEARVDFEREK